MTSHRSRKYSAKVMKAITRRAITQITKEFGDYPAVTPGRIAKTVRR